MWVLAAVVLIAAVLVVPRALRIDTWTRPHPLEGAIGVASVADGVIVLVDGRKFRPAGVLTHPDIDPAAYDEALRIACAQGVTLLRDLGDGRAFLQAEPKFYNWCGTRTGYGLNPFGRWAGGYFQAPLSEFLIFAGYAVPVSIDPALSEFEKWRIEGAPLLRAHDEPMRRYEHMGAFAFSGTERFLSEYEAACEAVLKRAPE